MVASLAALSARRHIGSVGSPSQRLGFAKAACGVALLTLSIISSAAANQTSDENQRAGDDGWKEIVANPFTPAFDTVSYVKGYASATSVNIGEPITFYVSVNNAPDSAYSLAIYRLGYYQGHGGRLMLRYPNSGYASGHPQAPCIMKSGPPVDDGMVACNWTPTYRLTIPTNWVSGLYVAKITLKTPTPKIPGYNYIVFTVRDDAREAAIIYQQPVATYQAYNGYGGSSLYGCFVAASCTAGRPAVKESFDRPYAYDGLASLFSWEQPFIFWLEHQGYDVRYSTDLDTHLHPDRVLTARIFLTAGHGEYWSRQMYDAVENARDRGVHLAFFGGNTLYWQARFESSPFTGIPDRVIVVYRNSTTDPIADPALKTVNWRDLGRPEQSLLGLQWGNGKPYLDDNSAVPWVVTNASHWIYAGTGATEGQSIGGIIGEEWDSVFPDQNGSVPDYVGQPHAMRPSRTAALPPHTRFDVVEHSTLQPSQVSYLPPAYDLPMTTDAVIYQALSGSYVFSAGSVMWGTLSQRSPLMQTVANNVLRKMLSTTPARHDIGIVNAICETALLNE